MVTKEQAINCRKFVQIAEWNSKGINCTISIKSIKWRANGKCKIWKTRPDEFKLPIKHGLYSHWYLTNENAHLFEVIR